MNTCCQSTSVAGMNGSMTWWGTVPRLVPYELHRQSGHRHAAMKKDGVMQNEPATRKLKISILRFNPQERGSVPRMVTYELDETEGMTLFMALNEIREKQEPSLQFDLVCRAGICGSCGMIINGRPALACRTLT